MPEVEDSALPAFALPTILDNGHGWGPCGLPDTDDTDGLPFAPFNKNDRLGRISDWTQQGQMNRRGGRGGRFNQAFGMGQGMFQYRHEDDESSFSLVDNKPKPKARFGRRPFRPQGNWNSRGRGNWRGGRGGWNRGGRGGRGGNNNRWGNNRWGYNRYNRDPEIKDPSVDVPEEWKVVETLEFATLEKASSRVVGKVENLVETGVLEMYNPAFDRVTPSKAKNLMRFETTQHFTATTSHDPVIQRLADKNAGNVYATDAILSVLMAATKSVISWDVLVRKEKGVIFFDKRPYSKIDFLTVNENWNEIIQTDKESVNHAFNLSREATLINHNFSQQVLTKDDPIKQKEVNPFLEGLDKNMTAATGAFHYRKFDLGDGIQLVSRCTVNGYCKRQGKNLKMTVRALNEFDSKLVQGTVDWRQKLETQTGAVLATEMKNNSAKLARWTAETVLAGSDEFRLGFVSRTHVKDSYKHTVLMTKRFEPKAFAQSTNTKISQLWGVLKTVITTLNQQEDGTFLIMKDPNKPQISIYECPADAFAYEEEGDEE